jgi:putative membrane protein
VVRSNILETFSTLPNVGMYLAAGAVALTAFGYLYSRFTPHDDFLMIRAGYTPASILLGSGLLGFVLPLAVLVIQAASLVDFFLWAVIATVVQCLAFAVARYLLLKESPITPFGSVIIEVDAAQKRDLEQAAMDKFADQPVTLFEPDMSRSVFVAFINIAAGILNAAVLF